MAGKKQKLELTWIGKDERPRLEPRILLEDSALSYHAAKRVTDEDNFDNILIHGDNLLALKALEHEYGAMVKCVYIDPPFNTGDMFENYNDGIEHSLWLGSMRERLRILYNLLSRDGSIFIHLNDDELDYCKVIVDEIFGRSNFVNRITVAARSPSAFSTVNPGVFKASEYLLWYAKNKSVFVQHSGRVRRDPDYAYNKWICNPDDNFESWKIIPLMEAYEQASTSRSKRPDSILEHFHKFIIDNAKQVCRLASISDSGAGEAVVSLKRKSESVPGRIFKLSRGNGLDDIYILDGQQLLIYERNIAEIDGVRCATSFMTNIWSDIAWEGIAGEGRVTFRKGKKPERLIKRCFDLCTNSGDLVLDSFAGSGTTGAVAQKMGRRWIMIELEDHCETHIIPRLRRVIDGSDGGGVTSATGWKGGGGFRYFRLAPSLLDKDKWGNWVVSKAYRPEMLAEAMCKLEGFRYEPDPDVFWIHGRSTETDYLYVTTQNLSHEQLQFISDQVGPERTLLICCGAFRAKRDDFANLTLKKIPQAVLDRCEWGRDDYSLNVQALPPVEAAAARNDLGVPEDGEGADGDNAEDGVRKEARRPRRATTVQEVPLFGAPEEDEKIGETS